MMKMLLTPWCRVLLGKLTGSQLVKKFLTFYGIRRFITAFTSAVRLSLSWARSVVYMPPHPSSWDPSYYYSPIYAWVFQVVSFPQVSPSKPNMHLSSPLYVLYAHIYIYIYIYMYKIFFQNIHKVSFAYNLHYFHDTREDVRETQLNNQLNDKSTLVVIRFLCL